MAGDTDQDFKELAELEIPARRAAFSDRTAYLMAVLAEIAYTPLDEETPDQILALAGELAGITDATQIADRLKEVQKVLAGLNPPPASEDDSNAVLKAMLGAGGFNLVGVLHNVATDTQGYVAVKMPDPNSAGDYTANQGLLVLAFRGTKQPKDWMTNLDVRPEPVRLHGKGAIRGNLHKGFHDAYKSVEVQVGVLLAKHPDVPLYITGHSLGGALAVTATWFQLCRSLAACYTFGAPRVCDQDLMDEFKTPIYRIVNGPDPVPFVPPSGAAINFFKGLTRLMAALLPFFGFFDKLTDLLIKQQKFRHAGNMRYLTVCAPGPNGDYPDLRLEYGLSTLGRLGRYFNLIRSGEANRIDRYHDMKQYKDKLAAFARCRNRRES
ncbi:lipase family protein [bacterium SCSIO 12827]|nr:lipase family protein [bacterium SCSIO 12827]